MILTQGLFSMAKHTANTTVLVQISLLRGELKQMKDEVEARERERRKTPV